MSNFRLVNPLDLPSDLSLPSISHPSLEKENKTSEDPIHHLYHNTYISLQQHFFWTFDVIFSSSSLSLVHIRASGVVQTATLYFAILRNCYRENTNALQTSPITCNVISQHFPSKRDMYLQVYLLSFHDLSCPDIKQWHLHSFARCMLLIRLTKVYCELLLIGSFLLDPPFHTHQYCLLQLSYSTLASLCLLV